MKQIVQQVGGQKKLDKLLKEQAVTQAQLEDQLKAQMLQDAVQQKVYAGHQGQRRRPQEVLRGPGQQVTVQRGRERRRAPRPRQDQGRGREGPRPARGRQHRRQLEEGRQGVLHRPGLQGQRRQPRQLPQGPHGQALRGRGLRAQGRRDLAAGQDAVRLPRHRGHQEDPGQQADLRGGQGDDRAAAQVPEAGHRLGGLAQAGDEGRRRRLRRGLRPGAAHRVAEPRRLRAPPRRPPRLAGTSKDRPSRADRRGDEPHARLHRRRRRTGARSLAAGPLRRRRRLRPVGPGGRAQGARRRGRRPRLRPAAGARPGRRRRPRRARRPRGRRQTSWSRSPARAGRSWRASCGGGSPARRRPEPLPPAVDLVTVPAGQAFDDALLGQELVSLKRIVDVLRVECPWDREQTPQDIVGYTVEEVHELADAIAAGDLGAEHGELGDLLLQVVLLALMLGEQGAGDLASVAHDIEVKLIRRHPHIFADAVAETPADVKSRWERIKVEQEGRQGIFHDVPAGFPALLLRQEAAAARRQRRLRLGLGRRGLPQDRRGARRAGGAVRRGGGGRRAPRRPRLAADARLATRTAPTRASRTRSATCSSPPSTWRACCTWTRSSRCARPATASSAA